MSSYENETSNGKIADRTFKLKQTSNYLKSDFVYIWHHLKKDY